MSARTTTKRKRNLTAEGEDPGTGLGAKGPPAAAQVTVTCDDDGEGGRAEFSRKKKTRAVNAVPANQLDGVDTVVVHPDKERDPWAVPVSAFFKVNPPPRDRPVRIYSDGIFDLFHFGHAKALEQAKKAFPNVYLLVGVCNDELTHQKKGKTVLTDHERYESVRHCKWVDEVITNAPWTVDSEFLDAHKIDYVAHDDIPYVSEGTTDVYAFVKERGQFLPTRRTEGVSTSDLITRIVRDYDSYIRRNLERGVPAKELNIGFLKSRELQMKKKVDDLRKDWRGTREEFKHELGELKNELRQTFSSWEDRSSDFIRGFIQLFGTDGVVGKILRIRSSSAPPTDDEDADSDSDTKDSISRRLRLSRSPPPRQNSPRSPLAGLFNWVGSKEEEQQG